MRNLLKQVTMATLVLCCGAGLFQERLIAATAADPGWPRAYTTSAGARVQIYQPQIRLRST